MTKLLLKACIHGLLLFFFSVQQSEAQVVPDTLELDEIRVQATRYHLQPNEQPVKVQQFDADDLTVYSGDNISRILEERGNVFVRNYGTGGLATVSMRGMNPNQTQVLWNGFTINDPMNGLIDFSLIPANFVNSLEISPGNSSTAYGSGASGGSIHLDTGFRTRGASAWQTFGAFGQNVQGIGGGWNENNWHGTLMFQRERSENDFAYQAASETGRRNNNAIEGLHTLATVGYENPNISVNSTFWWYDVENEIPGSLNFPSNNAVQTDRAVRWLNQAVWNSGDHRLNLNLMLSSTDQTYSDPDFDTFSENATRHAGGELAWRFQPAENLTLTQVAALSQTSGESGSYEERRSQTVFGFQTNPVWRVSDQLRLFSGLRYDNYEISGDALSASLGFNFGILPDHLILRGQASRNFVAPTFNDLFWVPSGNPDLEPETNLKAEAGLLHTAERGVLDIETELSFFAGRHFDGIRWIFSPEAGYFEAQNIDEIFVRGFELGSTQRWNFTSDFSLGSGVSVRQTLSTIEDYGLGDDSPEIGNQLIYTPEWVFQFNLSAEYRALSAGFNHVWNDERYTTQDHTGADDPLASYQHSNAHISASLPFYRFRLDLTGRLKNVFDQQYQVINGYPVPGRHFQVTARLNFMY